MQPIILDIRTLSFMTTSIALLFGMRNLVTQYFPEDEAPEAKPA